MSQYVEFAWLLQEKAKLDSESKARRGETMFSRMDAPTSATNTSSRIENDIKSEIKYSLIDVAPNGRFVFRSNYPTGTQSKVKGNRIVDLVQSVWAYNPISLTIWNDDGSKKIIEANFDPALGERTDLAKIAFGNKRGNATSRRMTLDLADDLYFIAYTSQYYGSKTAEEKSWNAAHKGVHEYFYFVNDIYYQSQSDSSLIPARMVIDVKENDVGNFFYSFHIEPIAEMLLLEEAQKNRNAQQTFDAAVAEESPDSVSKYRIDDEPEYVKRAKGVISYFHLKGDAERYTMDSYKFHDENPYDYDADETDYFKKMFEFLSNWQTGVADESNFFSNTMGAFTPIESIPNREPDYISYGKGGTISSEYWYTREGVIRGSNHWGRYIRSCDWMYGDSISDDIEITEKKYGMCQWNSFVYKTEFANDRKSLKGFGGEDGAEIISSANFKKSWVKASAMDSLSMDSLDYDEQSEDRIRLEKENTQLRQKVKSLMAEISKARGLSYTTESVTRPLKEIFANYSIDKNKLGKYAEELRRTLEYYWSGVEAGEDVFDEYNRSMVNLADKMLDDVVAKENQEQIEADKENIAWLRWYLGGKKYKITKDMIEAAGAESTIGLIGKFAQYGIKVNFVTKNYGDAIELNKNQGEYWPELTGRGIISGSADMTCNKHIHFNIDV